ncbi:MAG: DNA integrity scanning protein DisA nucleotide-binding domain protein [Bacilli bacterium]|nr:DNA integrity scanning protein DisA nucleotide-binding domain protein [Bacilli bacterium]
MTLLLPTLLYTWPNYSDVSFWVALSLSFLLFLVVDLFFFRIVSRKLPIIFLIVLEVVYFATVVLGLEIATITTAILLTLLLVTLAIVNMNELRIIFANVFKGNGLKFFGKHNAKQPEALFDREAMYRKINEAVQWFSRNRCGALITFEKRDNLDSYIATGIRVNCPVSSEMLETIFYEGTRLHDGAVIIRNDQIVSAACLYQPSTRPVSGKMGLRHRAAMGISQDTDSVTIVVSEETGRISIAYGGELRPVNSSDFLEAFEDYMALIKTEEES